MSNGLIWKLLNIRLTIFMNNFITHAQEKDACLRLHNEV